MPSCPICKVESHGKREGTPYWTCANCQTWWQDPFPPKRWHGDHETWVGQPMSDGEKQANRGLANWLFGKAMGDSAGPVLDVGCGYPILVHYLKHDHQCDAVGMEADGLPNDLGIKVLKYDFEKHDLSTYPWPITHNLSLVTFVHTFEHLYDPVTSFRWIHYILSPNGHLFIRMPDHTVAGYERDLTEGHYSIHPFYYCFQSVLELCFQTGLFTVDWTGELNPGQRDILLKPV